MKKVLLATIIVAFLLAEEGLKPFLSPTPLLDTEHRIMEKVICGIGMAGMSPRSRVIALYFFIRDNLPFYLSLSSFAPASRSLLSYSGDMVSKPIIAAALFRKAGVPSRLHFFTVKKEVFRELIPSYLYPLVKEEVLFASVEAYMDGEWVSMEELIYDRAFLQAIKRKASDCRPVSGHGIALADPCSLSFEWKANRKIIPEKYRLRDLGRFPSPDEFLEKYRWGETALRTFALREFIIKKINESLKRIRKSTCY